MICISVGVTIFTFRPTLKLHLLDQENLGVEPVEQEIV